MTVIVGVCCSDGVVLGADSAATNTAGPMPLLRMGTDKIQTIKDRVMFGTTGSVGLSQRLQQILESQYEKKLFGKESCIPAARLIAHEMIQDMRNTGVPVHPQNGWSFGALMAAQFTDGVRLVEFSTTDFQPEIKKDKLFFASLGSGQTLADPFLSFVKRVLWEDKAPTIDVARFGIHWALQHTIQCAPGFVGEPISLGIFGKKNHEWQCRLLESPQLLEQKEFITEIESYIRRYKAGQIEQEAPSQNTPPPQPPSAS